MSNFTSRLGLLAAVVESNIMMSSGEKDCSPLRTAGSYVYVAIVLIRTDPHGPTSLF